MESFLWWVAGAHIAAVVVAALCGWFVRQHDKEAWRIPSDRVVSWAIALLILLGALFLFCPFLYLCSYSSPHAHEKAVEAFYDCASFSLPCFAGIVAGFGLVSERGKDYRSDRNAWAYLGSAVALAVAYAFYVARHPRPIVVFASGLYVCLAGFAALETLLIQHFLVAGQADAGKSAVTKEGALRARWGLIASFGEALMAVVLCVLVAEAMMLLAYALTVADLAVMRLRPDK
ncbi:MULTISPECIES: hypothetical protein [unclassified Luteibacter]|uniref:hypothetical protein n=1 Tax=Luteibacter sp. PvP019 TaxID=3156436 RepID=UPI0033910D40